MVVIHQPVSDENKRAAKLHSDELLQTLAKPGGFAKLTTVQRKFLMGLILASIVPADKRIRNIELERLQVMLRAGLHFNNQTAQETMAIAEGQAAETINIDSFAKALPELLGIEDRCQLVYNLWELALCDNELHSFEEQLVYKVSDLAGVPRKKVAEMMSKAAARA
jgi:uncharacterized tellurite resistance protein B-like protein